MQTGCRLSAQVPMSQIRNQNAPIGVDFTKTVDHGERAVTF